MEKTHNKTGSTTNESAKNLTCWRTATSPQCLRVETTGEIHLFPYGYFQHAKFIRQNGKEVVQIKFQDQIIFAKGKGLESLCDALERLAVGRIKICPEKYRVIAGNEGVIEEIEIKQRDKEN